MLQEPISIQRACLCFEPIGGTAPNFTGKNQINPMAAIGATQLMLDHLGESKACQAIEKAKLSVLAKMSSMQAGKMGYGTSEIGDMMVDRLMEVMVNSS